MKMKLNNCPLPLVFFELLHSESPAFLFISLYNFSHIRNFKSWIRKEPLLFALILSNKCNNVNTNISLHHWILFSQFFSVWMRTTKEQHDRFILQAGLRLQLSSFFIFYFPLFLLCSSCPFIFTLCARVISENSSWRLLFPSWFVSLNVWQVDTRLSPLWDPAFK